MRRNFLYAVVALAVLFNIPAFGQKAKRAADESATCSEPVYDRKAVSRPAKLTFRPEPGYTEEARAKQLSGRVILTAVLCRTGRVTDIVVVEGLPYGMTEKVVEAARRIKFRPAEKDSQEVSQRIRLVYQFHLF